MYLNLTLPAKMVYAILKDRMSLSRENGWINENGEVYLKYKRENLAKILGCSIPTAIKFIKELTKFGLIVDRQVGLNKANEIYICHVELPPNNMKKSGVEKYRSSKFLKSGCKNFLGQDLKSFYANETNNNDTDISDTTTITVSTKLMARYLVEGLCQRESKN